MGTTILSFAEEDRKTWRYPPDNVDGAFRLIAVDDLLSSQGAKITLVELRDLDIKRIRKKFIRYVAISHTWTPSKEAKRLSDLANRPLIVEVGDNRLHEMSWHGLCQAAKAARYFKCQYLWIDLLCLHQMSSRDKELQVGSMGYVYEKAFAVVVMPGGIVAAQGIKHETHWITRAWTLQEAVLCERTFVLILYPPIRVGYFESLGPVFNLNHVEGNLSLSSLPAILSCRHGLEIPVHRNGKRPRSLYFKTCCFGDDRQLIESLLAIAERQDLALRKSSIWRSMWLRTATRPQDIVFSVMHLLRVQMDVNYTRSVEDLVLELAAKSTSASWLDIGFDLPPNAAFGLLPAIPHYKPDSPPSYTVGEQIVPVRDYRINTFSYMIRCHTKVVSYGNKNEGYLICSRILPIGYEPEVPGETPRPKGSRYVEPTEQALDGCGSHVVVLSENTGFATGYFPKVTLPGPEVCFIRKSESQVWEVLRGRSRVPEDCVQGQPRSHIRLGGPPGAEITPCDCPEYATNPEPEPEPEREEREEEEEGEQEEGEEDDDNMVEKEGKGDENDLVEDEEDEEDEEDWNDLVEYVDEKDEGGKEE